MTLNATPRLWVPPTFEVVQNSFLRRRLRVMRKQGGGKQHKSSCQTHRHPSGSHRGIPSPGVLKWRHRDCFREPESVQPSYSLSCQHPPVDKSPLHSSTQGSASEYLRYGRHLNPGSHFTRLFWCVVGIIGVAVVAEAAGGSDTGQGWRVASYRRCWDR